MTRNDLMTFMEACPDDVEQIAQNGFIPSPESLLKLAAAGVSVPAGQPTEDERFSLDMDFLEAYSEDVAKFAAMALDETQVGKGSMWEEFMTMSRMSKKALALKAWCRRTAASDPAKKARYEKYCAGFDYGCDVKYQPDRPDTALDGLNGAVSGKAYSDFINNALEHCGKAKGDNKKSSDVSARSLALDMLGDIQHIDGCGISGRALYILPMLKAKCEALLLILGEQSS